MTNKTLIERGNEALWNDFLSVMPQNWKDVARQLNIMKGAKRDKDIDNALRALFVYIGTGASLKETSAYAKSVGLGNISSVSLFHRLIKFGPFFLEMCKQMMAANAMKSCTKDTRLLLVDASDIKEPGPTGSHYRFHYCASLSDFCCNHMELTSTAGKGTGETLERYPVVAGDHFVADRGYSFARGIFHVAQHGGFVLIRLNHSALPLFSSDQSVFPLMKNLRSLTRPGDAGSWECKIRDTSTGQWLDGRICAIRKDSDATNASLGKAKEEARRKGKKVTEKTLELCSYTVLFTTFESKKYPLRRILEIYRWRWQIELIFKRFKSLLALGCLPKTISESSQAWIYGKFFLALLIEKICYQQGAFSPWRKLSGDDAERQRQLVAAF